MKEKVTVIIPTYNEIDNIKIIIEKIFSFIKDINIIVVDDNSPDLTWQYVEKLALKNPKIHLIKNPKKGGIAKAYKIGFRKALELGSDIMVQMDCDLSHDPKYLKGMIEKTKENDLIIGSRYKTGINVINWPIKRVLLSYYANRYTSFVTRMNIRDFTSGFKVFRRKVIENLDFNKVISDGYSFQIEVNYIVKKLGFKVYEYPIVFTDRVNGVSKLDGGIIFEALFNVVKLRFKKIKPVV